jgi:hypothetical protein
MEKIQYLTLIFTIAGVFVAIIIFIYQNLRTNRINRANLLNCIYNKFNDENIF